MAPNKLKTIKSEIQLLQEQLHVLKALERAELKKSVVQCQSNPKLRVNGDSSLWKVIEKASKEVDSWPEWKRKAAGVIDNVVIDGCGEYLSINNLVYLQTHFYRGPYGCTGGDYWSPGEGQFVCPKCGYKNRLYHREDVEQLKEFFGTIKDIYEE